MKQLIIYFTLLLCNISMYAQTERTINVSTAGTLESLIGSDKNIVTNLILTGTVNDADFTTLKQMAALKNLNMENVDIENGTIPGNAFQHKVFENILLPKSLVNIGSGAFQNITTPKLDFTRCVNLETINSNAFINSNITENTLDFSKCLKLVNFPVSTYGPFRDCTAKVILPENMITLPNNIFKYFRGSVELSDKIETIGVGAFSYATPTNSINLPSGLKVIGENAFAGMVTDKLDFTRCVNLETINSSAFINSNITENTLDFSKCLKLVNFPVSTYGPFRDCTAKVILPENMITLPNNIFKYFRGSVELSDKIETIGVGAFSYATPTNSINLPSGLKVIGENAFAGMVTDKLDFTRCVNLETINSNAFINSNITENTLDFSKCLKLVNFPVSTYGPFRDCSAKVILPENMITLPNNIFKYFRGSVDLSDKIETIGVGAFSQSTLTSISLPVFLKLIGRDAFTNCSKLEIITSKNPEPPTLGNTVFRGVNTANCKLVVPDGAIDLYKTKEQWKDFLNIEGIEPEQPESPYMPDPYEKGKEGNIFISIPTFYWSNGTDLTGYDYDTNTATGAKNPIQKTYKTIDIDEYSWTTENLRLKYGLWQYINFSQDEVNWYTDTYMNGVKMTVEEFERVFGSWITEDEMAWAYRRFPEAYDQRGGNKQEGWGLPSSEDIWQLYGQAPKLSDNYYENIKDFLFASACDNNYGWTQDMFNRRNISGLTLMPLGVRKPGNQPEESKDRQGFGEIMNWVTDTEAKREFLQEWNWDKFTFPSGSKGLLAHPKTWYWGQARYRRAKTAEELGYRLYIDAPNDKIQMLPHTQVSTLPELPKGLERGIALRYTNREHMKVLRKWSEIQQEATQIRNNLTVTLPGAPILSCDGEGGGEEPEKPIPPINISTDQNYIHTTTYMDETQSSVLDNIQYFDGLGRPVQTVQRAVNPDRKDLVTHHEYDVFGREGKTWLPVISENGGAYVSPADNNIQSMAITMYSDSNPYSEPIYEASPLNRILKQYGPGEKWHTASGEKGSVQTAYQTNSEAGDMSAILYEVGGDRKNPTLKKNGNYAAGDLYVTQVSDEEGNVSYEFKDKLGRVVLTRQINEEKDKKETLDTYYVFDDFGNQCFVIPPMAAGVADQNDERIGQFAYLYQYDDRNRCIAKKLPGCDWIHYVYDRADRLILSQDGEQRLNKEWAFTKCDRLGRVLLSGVQVINQSADELRAKYKDLLIAETTGDGSFGYTWNTLPEVKAEGVLIANHYDDYDHLLNRTGIFRTELEYKEVEGYGKKYINEDLSLGEKTPKGLLVGTRVRHIDHTGKFNNQETTTAMYYDNRGRVIQTRTRNHMGGKNIESYAYNFTGQVTRKKLIHSISGSAEQSEVYAYTYDHALRLKQVTHSLNGGAAVVLANNEYDDLGRLKSTKAANHANLKTNYAYNIRSWTESINNNLYTQSMDYTLNGNVDWMTWTQNGQEERKYDFGYDGLSRLTYAKYNNDQVNGQFSTSYSYDQHGNIKTLKRNGEVPQGVVNNMRLHYVGNQLQNIENTAPKILKNGFPHFFSYSTSAEDKYDYNQNGAMTIDPDKKVRISYNYLNLPKEVIIDNASAKAKNYYTYSATGQKLRVESRWDETLAKTPITGTSPSNDGLTPYKTTDYIGNMIYEDNILKTTLLGNGYYDHVKNKYYFYLRDHLGNNRIVADNRGSVLQSTEYYPFGLEFANGFEKELQPYKYGNKELDSDHNLNLYDFVARYMNPAVPRFTSVDPHAENYYSWSPYAYAANNPLRITDPTGMDWFVNNENGNLFFLKDISELNDDLVQKYNLGNIENYENLGSDDMFGDEVKYGRFENLLEQDFISFESPDNSEQFMNRQGYEKGQRADIKEQKIITTGDDGFSAKPYRMSHYELKIQGKQATTYVQSKDINKKMNLSINYSYPNSMFSYMETVQYSITRSHGQDINNTSYYKAERSMQSTNSLLQLIGSVILSLFK